MAPSDLKLRVLGTASLHAVEGANASPLLGPGKALALVTYLAFSPRRTATREHLVDLLWADADPDGARRNLRQTVYQLRRLIGEACLVGEADQLTIACPTHSDRDDFLAAIEAGDLQRAVDTYGGPFFPAFAAPGGAGFEHWADLERQRLQAAFLRALEAIAREALGRHRLRDAVALARRLRDAAPEREASWRLLLEAEMTAGDWVQAAAEADRCEGTLRDLGRNLEPATAAFLRAARQAPALSTTRDVRLVVEMIGRDAEFAAIIAAWDTASRSRLRHVHVLGTAGIGKTRLLQDAAARIASVGGHVVQARATQGERDLPFAAAGDLVRRLAALPGAGGVAPATADVLVALDPALSARFPNSRARTDDGEEALRVRTTSTGRTPPRGRSSPAWPLAWPRAACCC